MKSSKLSLITIAIVLLFTYCSSDELKSCDSEHATVCSFTNGTKTCCPVKDGTCCSDTNYCCPRGFKCDTPNGRCIKDDQFLPYYLRTEVLDLNYQIGKDVLCPDNQTICKETQTCCPFGDSGEYGCCPILHALCCEDKVHCCPKSYKCNPSKGKCDRVDLLNGEIFSIKWYKKEPGNKLNPNELCPDKKSQCPSGSTCCELNSGDYGCCPLPKAVCCEDHLHCCPEGHTCDVKAGRCNKKGVSIPFFEKTEALKLNSENSDVKMTCQDGESECPSGTTCCELESGGYGCCPLPKAVCCQDHLHCCPTGYTCDVKASRCNKGRISIPFFTKFPAEKINKNEIDVKQTCPGGSAECPSGSTCCQLSSGDWGCCPIPNAICCQDHQHCCPEGYTCDVKAGRCNKAHISIPFLVKTKAVSITKENVKIACPGGDTECPTGSTCCLLESGDYGCCPIENAVCCEDHQHCCPSGYICDIKAGRCSKGELSIPFYKKFLATFKKSEKKTEKESVDTIAKKDYKFDPNSVVCPDGCSFCPNGYTCCKLSDNSYGCCPIPNAICCEDHLHCCPQNTHCNLKEKSCDQNGKSVMSWLEKIPSKLIFHKTEPKVANDPIVCDDNVTTCDPLDTCCKMADGTYGCCPYTDGVCCTELSFCCPGDSICGNKIGLCLKKNRMEKLEGHAGKIEKEKIDCEGTVCQRQDGQNICCPYSNGTCCGSHGYCCPQGYNCNPKDETCQMNDPDISKPIKKASLKIKQLGAESNYDTMIECQDSVHFCPDSSTCCKTKESYGCCAIENAVCCEDGINCCPQGYVCATNSTTTCLKKGFKLTTLN